MDPIGRILGDRYSKDSLSILGKKSLVGKYYEKPTKTGALSDSKIIYKKGNLVLAKRAYVENGKNYDVYMVSTSNKFKEQSSSTVLKLMKEADVYMKNYEIRGKVIWVKL